MLQELLEKNQITQQALAEKLNVSQQAVSKWNNKYDSYIYSRVWKGRI